MLSSSPRPSADHLSFTLATSKQRAQALAHARKRLEPQLPNFSDAQWESMFNTYAPALSVEHQTGAVTLADDALLPFANWVHLHQDTENDVSLYGHEAYYLARNLVSYAQEASDLVAADPELTKPESIGVMRALFQRLSVGNVVAERVYHACQKPDERAR
ncbi:hypothetical protein K3G63_11195 [Hymenobacter sp. HSC-4F20]|uniref:hypothetical protein n=1 Tax=Hymenobacter sp. HSC-4F20 TaxID=2864135 RepID=UPI001C7377C5|nr:hypothetical protein [Hymenobacter sp. HSC-4F20]MBX0291009.1 hypothetical protein [Hymenobacter sp. HSC-4F20]